MNQELDHGHSAEFEPLLDTQEAAKLLGAALRAKRRGTRLSRWRPLVFSCI